MAEKNVAYGSDVGSLLARADIPVPPVRFISLFNVATLLLLRPVIIYAVAAFDGRRDLHTVIMLIRAGLTYFYLFVMNSYTRYTPKKEKKGNETHIHSP